MPVSVGVSQMVPETTEAQNILKTHRPLIHYLVTNKH